MKRLLISICIVLLLSGCAQRESAFAEELYTTEQSTEAFIREKVTLYSQEQAMIEGFLVMQLGDVRYNQQNWFAFLEKTRAGENAELKVIHFFDDGTGWGQILYELSYDGLNYTVCYEKDGQQVTDTAAILIEESGELADTDEPYDTYQRYRLNVILYEDRVIVPAFDAHKPISLLTKEGDPALRDYITDEELAPIVSLLSGAEYLPCEPEDYLYGMKLLTADVGGDGIVIELDLRYGNYRYGTQVFHYGEIADLFAVLGLDQWPDSVQNEFKDYLN